MTMMTSLYMKYHYRWLRVCSGDVLGGVPKILTNGGGVTCSRSKNYALNLRKFYFLYVACLYYIISKERFSRKSK